MEELAKKAKTVEKTSQKAFKLMKLIRYEILHFGGKLDTKKVIEATHASQQYLNAMQKLQIITHNGVRGTGSRWTWNIGTPKMEHAQAIVKEIHLMRGKTSCLTDLRDSVALSTKVVADESDENHVPAKKDTSKQKPVKRKTPETADKGINVSDLSLAISIIAFIISVVTLVMVIKS